MYFNRLPKELHPAIIALTKDAEFNKILSNDKILDELEDQEIDKEFEAQCLRVISGKNLQILGHEFKPITPIAVMKMWCNNNPMITGEGHIQPKHIDEFFHLLEYPESNESGEGFTQNYLDIIDKLDEVVETEMKIAFFPLTFFPESKIKGGGEQAVFDSDWLMRVCSIACDVGNYKIEEAMRKPLYILTSSFIQYSRKNGGKNIERLLPQEILEQQAHRVAELVIDRLIALNKIDKSKREEYIELCSNKE